jgi:thymidylate synthase
MRELLNVYFQVKLTGRGGPEDLKYYQRDIGPNLPWADRHFELERVSGEPINPGETWKEWPYAHSADKFRRAGECFSHTYAERYWPKEANGELLGDLRPLQGVRYLYGDLNDVVRLLVREPLTRQAYLPVWFPEDTGVVHGERVPCTLGYHFMRRNDELSVFYPIRSCDFVRHFRDDLYLTVRLLLWVLYEARKLDPTWNSVRPGIFTMWIGSLHCFLGDYQRLFRVKG